jgi:hypothetical protein
MAESRPQSLSLVAFPDDVVAEMEAARQVGLNYSRTNELLETALRQDRITGPSPAAVALDGVSVYRLTEAIQFASRHGCQSAHSRALLAAAVFVRSVRTAVLQLDWGRVAALLRDEEMAGAAAGVALALADGLVGEELAFVRSALQHRRDLEALRAALATGGPGGDPGALDTTRIALDDLDAMIAHFAGGGGSDDLARHLDMAALLTDLREAVKADDWEVRHAMAPITPARSRDVT